MTEPTEPAYVTKAKAFVEANHELSPEVGYPPETDWTKMSPSTVKILMLGSIMMWSSTTMDAHMAKDTKKRIGQAEHMLRLACATYEAACEAADAAEKK